MRSPKECPKFDTCSAPLCPLDPELKKRIWYWDEPICKNKKFQKLRWIKKQKSIQKRKFKSWLKKPITIIDLIRASRPRKLTPEERAKIGERLKRGRESKKICLSQVNFFNLELIFDPNGPGEGLDSWKNDRGQKTI